MKAAAKSWWLRGDVPSDASSINEAAVVVGKPGKRSRVDVDMLDVSFLFLCTLYFWYIFT